MFAVPFQGKRLTEAKFYRLRSDPEKEFAVQ